MMPIRLATRRSALALAQARQVADLLTEVIGAPVDLVGVTSLGDTSTAPLTAIGGTGVFVTAVRDAVLRGEADLAVHSLKDLPTQPPEGLELVAVPRRGEPRDALVSSGGRSLAQLPSGSVVGTGSPRRQAQLRRSRPDLTLTSVRGNVDTRLAKVDDGQLAAVVIAGAGLQRLGLSARIAEVLDPGQFLPAPGQGALAIEAATSCSQLFRTTVAQLDDAATRAAVTAERAALAGLEAGCSAPVGALATVARGRLSLTATVLDVEGGEGITTTVSGPRDEAEPLGRSAAGDLLNRGASRFIGEPVR